VHACLHHAASGDKQDIWTGTRIIGNDPWAALRQWFGIMCNMRNIAGHSQADQGKRCYTAFFKRVTVPNAQSPDKTADQAKRLLHALCNCLLSTGNARISMLPDDCARPAGRSLVFPLRRLERGYPLLNRGNTVPCALQVILDRISFVLGHEEILS
jgi:hypothetical protein